MNIENFIKEDMWHGPDSPSMDVCSHQDSDFPCPPALDIDVDVLFHLTQDEIQIFDRFNRDEWGQSRWSNSKWECDEVIGGPENHWEAMETGLHRNSWEMSPTTSSDPCAIDWPFLNHWDELSPNIPDEILPMCGLHSPNLHHQPTEPSINGLPLVCTEDYKQDLQLETHIEEIPHDVGGPLLQATTSEISRTEVIRAGITQNTSGRCTGLSPMQPLPDGQLTVEMHLNQEIEPRPSLGPQKSRACPTLPSQPKADSFSAESSSHRKGMRPSVLTPPHPLEISRVNSPPATLKSQHTNTEQVLHDGTLPACQSSLPEKVVERRATRRTSCSTFGNSPCTSKVTCSPKRSLSASDGSSLSGVTNTTQNMKRKRRQSADPEELASRKLESQLIEWGFVRNGGTIRCACGKTFGRRWDARRHWTSASIHKAERQKLGDFSDSIQNRCAKCGEVLARKDSLERHLPYCGQRKKRRHKHGWNPNGSISSDARQS